MAFRNPKVLFPELGIRKKRWFGLGLRVSNGLARGERTQKRRGIDDVNLRSGEELTCGLRLLLVRSKKLVKMHCSIYPHA